MVNIVTSYEEDFMQYQGKVTKNRENIKYYKRLCVQELEWCRNNSEVICNKANVLYKKYIMFALMRVRNMREKDITHGKI